MSVNCTICGEEIPPSIFAWCKDGKGDQWVKGYIFANIDRIMKDESDLRSWEMNKLGIPDEDQRNRAQLITRCYLRVWNNLYETRIDEWDVADQICWSCALKMKRKCLMCDDIFELSDISEYSGYKRLLHEYIHEYQLPICHHSGDYCENPRCQMVQKFLARELAFPGYTKRIAEAKLLLFKSEDLETFRTFVVAQLVAYGVSEFKKQPTQPDWGALG